MKIIRKGFGQAMEGNTLWINTQTDERITVDFKQANRETAWKLYCKYLKVTIEVIDESELDKIEFTAEDREKAFT